MKFINYFTFFKKATDTNNYFNELPAEIIMLIASKLDNNSIAKFGLTSKENYYIAQDTTTYIDVVINYQAQQVARINHRFSNISHYLKKQANIHNVINNYEQYTLSETINLMGWIIGGVTLSTFCGYTYGSFTGWLGGMLGGFLDSSLNYITNATPINIESSLGSWLGCSIG
ncbi:hypothetical protein [Legionella gresilensis]|uniref:hypothetical protein n=1 Tax=Legionella gresilensis TaxID=91823 RepID=UPI001041B837|nr:hypothetical protein [Legionella gresilensis]